MSMQIDGLSVVLFLRVKDIKRKNPKAFDILVRICTNQNPLLAFLKMKQESKKILVDLNIAREGLGIHDSTIEVVKNLIESGRLDMESTSSLQTKEISKIEK